MFNVNLLRCSGTRSLFIQSKQLARVLSTLNTQKTDLPYLFKFTPTYVHKYLKLARLHQPIGNWLLFLPCAWSISLAPYEGFIFDPQQMLIFGFGSVLMRSAACMINDIWDRDLDAQVARTKDRPLASNQMSMSEAVLALNVTLLASFLLLIQLNAKCITIGVFSTIPVVFYPLCKRFISWPQLFLGATINIGALMGYPAVTDCLGLMYTIPLYFAAVSWTMIYDSVYAFQVIKHDSVAVVRVSLVEEELKLQGFASATDMKDDLSVGIRSTAISFSKSDPVKWLTTFYFTMFASLLSVGLLANLSIPFYTIASMTMLYYGHLVTFILFDFNHNYRSGWSTSVTQIPVADFFVRIATLD
ncbi:Para-hydroxybenzoate--polyprenyltransferase, mitochondrial precursor (PHB:polyprenyltransferase) [Cichlidogyrus casuarinus]|uniref:Para-hydroxybenzoate--polyprenyltransferase, mitochondrial (PHB:polyprenyltransferase) n=1 Tax=Cichlidogyrus casuarinus TaxID=1844966 RepID=A0ABD2PZL3_9PLAT